MKLIENSRILAILKCIEYKSCPGQTSNALLLLLLVSLRATSLVNLVHGLGPWCVISNFEHWDKDSEQQHQLANDSA